MKTAISIPDELYQRLEAVRAQMGISRSQVIQQALAEWLRPHSDTAVTACIDRVIEKLGDAARLDPDLEAAGLAVVDREDWS